MNHRLRVRFRLWTLFVLLTVTAVGCALWGRAVRFRERARQHHRAALHAGYAAAEIQKETNPDLAWSAIKHDEPPLKWDLSSVQLAAPLWRQAMYHAQLRKKYFDAAHAPWRTVAADDLPPGVEIPTAEELVNYTWHIELQAFLKRYPYFLLQPYVFEVHRDAKTIEWTNEAFSSTPRAAPR